MRLAEERTTIILPDVHVGWEPEAGTEEGASGVHTQELRQFLETLLDRPGPLRLIFIGDLVDLQRQEPLRAQLRLAAEVGDLLARLKSQGAEVVWLVGNHDYHLFDLMSGRTALRQLVERFRSKLDWRRLPDVLLRELEQALFEGLSPPHLISLFEQALPLGSTKYPVLEEVRAILREAGQFRQMIEAQCGGTLAYPTLLLGPLERPVFVTHGDAANFMLTFAKLEALPSDLHLWPRFLSWCCRRLARLRGVRRTDVFGFYHWLYAQEERSIAEFEAFFKQDPWTIIKLVSQFVASPYARRVLRPGFRRPLWFLGQGLAWLTRPLVKTLGWVHRLRRNRVAVRRSLGHYSRIGFYTLLSLSAVDLLWLVLNAWSLGANPPWGIGEFLLRAVALLISLLLATILLWGTGLTGMLWLEGFDEILVESLEQKQRNLQTALQAGWFGRRLPLAQLAHHVVGHFHYPEQTAPEDAFPLTDVGAWVGQGRFYVDGQWQWAKLMSYAEIQAGQVTLYNFLDRHHRLRFLGYRSVPGEAEPVRCWEREEVP